MANSDAPNFLWRHLTFVLRVHRSMYNYSAMNDAANAAADRTINRLEADALAMWDATGSDVVKMHLRAALEACALGVADDAADALGAAQVASRRRVRGLTRAMTQHIETAIGDVEAFAAVNVGSTWLEGTPDDLGAIADRLDTAADSVADTIEEASFAELSPKFLEAIAKRSARTMRRAVRLLRRAAKPSN